MKTAPQVAAALRTRHNVKALPKLIADWNMNRYHDTVVSNNPSEESEGYDPELFPLESIVQPNRPTKGASKAILNNSVVSDGYRTPNQPRFYVASVDDEYKYWVSPRESDSDGWINGVSPEVRYVVDSDAETPVAKDIYVNKIVIKLENSWATPNMFSIEVLRGSTWTQISGSTTPISNDGKITLYWNGTGWSSNKPDNLTALRDIRGIRMKVDSLGPGRRKDGTITTYEEYTMPVYEEDPKTGEQVLVRPAEAETRSTRGAYSRFSLIEIAAHREVDLSSYLVTVTDNFNAGEASSISPMGTITSNVGSIGLWNGDGTFSKDNPASTFAGMLKSNVEFNLSYVYHIDGAQYPVQQFKMYSENWTNQMEEVVNVNLSDASKFLKETYPPKALYENMTVRELVYRICDSVGFSDFVVVENPDLIDNEIKIFWTTGEMSVWEVLDELARGTQSLVYFDSRGLLNVKTRQAAYDKKRPVDWTLLGRKVGTDLPDIVDFTQTDAYDNNVVKVIYKNTKWSEFRRGQPAMEVSWEPEGTTVLRAAPLTKDLLVDDNYLHLEPKELKVWPYEGILNIEGEFIRFKGKQYVYHTYTEVTTVEDGMTKTKYTNKTANKVDLESEDDFKKYRSKTPSSKRWENYFTGKVRITERGVWNTDVKMHKNDIAKYNIRRLVNGNRRESDEGFKHNKKDSSITLRHAGNLKKKTDQLTVTTGSADTPGTFAQYGFRFHFEKGESYTDQIAGFVFHNSGINEKGYYVEFTPTSKLDGKDRAKRQEVNVYAKGTKQQGQGGVLDDDAGAARIMTRGKNDACDLPIDNGYKGPVEEPGGGGKGGKDGKDDKGGKGDGIPEGATAISASPRNSYDVDVYWEDLDGTDDRGNKHRISVWLNGKKVVETLIPSDQRQARNAKFGFYIRGKSSATFEYLYAIHGDSRYAGPVDDSSFLDRVRGGYYGGYADREIPYGWYTRSRIYKSKKAYEKGKRPIYFFDEFGPICHEVREYNVKFENAPVLHSRLYMTNDWASVCTEYRSNPFEAHFIVANASRKNAIINGDEQVGDNSIEHRLNVIGRPLVIEDAEELEFRNEDEIRAHGVIESTFDSDWIQSKAAANTIGDWVLDHWGDGADEQVANVFGNPLFEIGDMVAVDYPDKDLTPAEARYFVTSVDTTFEGGITTTLTLRRVTKSKAV